MIDIIVIGRNRYNILSKCLDSIWKTSQNYRLTLIDDFSDEIPTELLINRNKFHQIILNGQNHGSTLSMDTGLQLALTWQWFYNESPDDLVLFLEDDMKLSDDWQKTCTGLMNEYGEKYNIGFIGWAAPEIIKLMKEREFEYNGHDIRITDLVRSSMMFFRKSHLQKIGLIPMRNLDGTERGRPHNGLGSRRDHYLLNDAVNSNRNLKFKCAAISGIIEDLGDRQSTWRGKLEEETQ